VTIRKIVLVIADGLGDLPIAALGGATPLEAAATPVLDRWVAEGQCGLVDPVEPGLTVETHAGTGTLMGLTSQQVGALARGPIEAAGAGLELVEGDVALRCNFATVLEDSGALTIRDRRAGRIESTADLVAALNAIPPADGITTVLAPIGQHRAVLRLSGSGLSAAITDTDPGVGLEPQVVQWCRAVQAGDAAAERTAAALNRFLRRAHEVLGTHPANRERARHGLPEASGLLTRGAGFVHPVDGLIARLGLRGAVVGADRTVLGLGALLGFAPIVESTFTGLLDTDLHAKVAAVGRALRDHDIVWLHVKGSDIAAHDCRPEAKRDYLERLDDALASLAVEDLVVAVAADHTTDSNTGCHTSDPVPALARVPGGRRDHITSFGERACMRGGLGRLRSAEFLRVLLSGAGVSAGAAADDAAGPRRETDARDADEIESDSRPNRER
jgi:2,3-bisphosphoglycerate-independent phosphoglycerate mutase